MSSSHEYVGALVVYDKPMRKHAAHDSAPGSTVGRRTAPHVQDMRPAEKTTDQAVASAAGGLRLASRGGRR